jgi:hypothetical protein
MKQDVILKNMAKKITWLERPRSSARVIG